MEGREAASQYPYTHEGCGIFMTQLHRDAVVGPQEPAAKSNSCFLERHRPTKAPSSSRWTCDQGAASTRCSS